MTQPGLTAVSASPPRLALLAALTRGRAAPAQRGAAVLLGAACIALSAQAAIPFWPAPITLQTFAVALVAATLGLRGGVAAVAAYLAAGALGAPVFAMGGAGAGVLAGPTAGYLAGFLASAAAIGWLSDRGAARRIWTALPAFLVGDALVLLLGGAWISLAGEAVGFRGTTFAAATAPFVLGALVKSTAAALAVPVAWRVLVK